MTEEETKEKLYQEGLNYFKSGDYFEAHESWEDLWSDFYLEADRTPNVCPRLF